MLIAKKTPYIVGLYRSKTDDKTTKVGIEQMEV